MDRPGERLSWGPPGTSFCVASLTAENAVRSRANESSYSPGG